MLLTITTTHQSATDLGYLLHKHPDKCQTFSLSFGKAHVFYPEATVERCTAVLLLDINPVELVRDKSWRDGTLAHYVNDRPYVASSFLSVAIAEVYRTALTGRCQQLPELATKPIPLTVNLPVLPCRGGYSFLCQLFEPLGYRVEGKVLPFDEAFEKSDSIYIDVTLTNTVRLSNLLAHLYVLIPVLDDDKHYWVGEAEIEKLMRHGESWLNEHPLRDKITQRYLKRRRQLTQIALERLTEEDGADFKVEEIEGDSREIAIEKPISLNQQRLETVTSILKNYHAKRVVDLGCGEGKLLQYLLTEKTIEQITGVDVSHRALEIASKRLKLDELPTHQQGKIQLIQGSLLYRDRRLAGYDAATLIEVIEHLYLDRLATLERVVFEFARPKLVIVTTPNIEYNIRFALAEGKLRHHDHRFEWTRQEFLDWANSITKRFAYRVEFNNIGEADPELGAPTQMGIFTK